MQQQVDRSAHCLPAGLGLAEGYIGLLHPTKTSRHLVHREVSHCGTAGGEAAGNPSRAATARPMWTLPPLAQSLASAGTLSTVRRSAFLHVHETSTQTWAAYARKAQGSEFQIRASTDLQKPHYGTASGTRSEAGPASQVHSVLT
jgi:hypothetical protein